MKKIMSIMVLAMIFTFSCSFLDDDGASESPYYGWYGNGSATNYTISTAAQLRGLADIVRGTRGDSIPPQDDFQGKTITLTADIVASSEWKSIGYSYIPTSPFNGTFDGGNKTISGLSTNNQGVFGLIGEHGTVKNIIFTNFSLSGDDGSGGLARRNDGTVQNVGMNGSIDGGSLSAGLVYTNSGVVENSYFSGSLSGGGGIANSNSGTIRNCYSAGSLSGGARGGVVGFNSGIVQNCYSTIEITGSISGNSSNGNVGGIVGSNYNTPTSGTIQNSVALNQAILNPSLSTGRINTNLGRVSADNSGSKTNNYGLNEMVMQSGYIIASDATGRDGEDVTYSELDDANWWQNTVEFSSNVWEFRNGGLPILKNMPAGTQNPEIK